jgi:ATP-dependent Clp protease ATP-binding subunit ClpC
LLGWLRSWLAPPVPELDADTDLTDDAAAVMRRTAREAARRGHEYVGTEHILLGLMGTPGVVADLLSERGVSRQDVRREVERITMPGLGELTGRLPLTPHARRAVVAAIRVAQSLGHTPVAPAHLFLGLLGESEGVAFEVLRSLGLDPDATRRDVLVALDSRRTPRPWE